MQIKPPHASKYPYDNANFQQNRIDFLNQHDEITTEDNTPSRTEKQINSVAENAAFGSKGIEAQIFNFLDTLVQLGSKKILPDNGETLGTKVQEKLEDIYHGIELGNEPNQKVDDDGTDIGTDIDLLNQTAKSSKPDKELSSSQASHGKGLVLNFLRDFILERNYLSKTPQKKFQDPSGSNWESAAVSITGRHTEAVNSDSMQEAKNSSLILGVVADGISNMINPEDMFAFQSIRNRIRKGELDLEEANFELDFLYNRDTFSYGSHYLAKSITSRITDPELPKSLLRSAREESGTLSSKASETVKDLKKNPDYFWTFFKDYFDSGRRPDQDPDLNFYENFAQALENEPNIQKHIERDLPGFCEAIRNKETQLYLTAVAPIFIAKKEIEADFENELKGHPNSVNGGAQLAYAMDLGDKVALVRIGDAPIKAFNKDGDLIEQENNLETTEEETVMGSMHIDFDKETNKAELSLENTPFIEIIDKTKIDTIFMGSDGVLDQKTYKAGLNFK